MAIYNNFKAEVMKSTFNLGTDDVRVALLDSGYTPDIDANTQWSDVSANEISGTGYSAGGKQLTGVSVSVDSADDEGVLDASDTIWQTSTITARYAVLYDSTTASNYLVSYQDLGADKSSSEADFEVEWNAEGVINLT